MPRAKKKGYIQKEVLTEAERALRREIQGYLPGKYKNTFSKMITEMRKSIQSGCATRYGKIIKSEFSEPFLPQGFVDVSIGSDYLWLRIGRRDVSIRADGESLGAGTLLASPWEIKNISNKGGKR